jgi:hypothetical protein
MLTRRPLLLLLAVTALASLCIGFGVHLTTPFPNYAHDIAVWARSGRIADTFTPLGYPLFAGPAFRLAGNQGIIALQAVLQVAIAGVCFLILKELGLPSTWSAIGSLPVALHPDLLTSIVKIWDVPLSTFLLLLVVFLCLRVHHRSSARFLPIAIGIGVAMAAAVFCRPNYVVLFPIIFISFYSRRPSLSVRSLAVCLAVSAAVTCGVFALFGTAIHGRPFFPRNGSYNLYAGQNRHTMSALLHKLNAEDSIATDFLEKHPEVSDPDSNADLHLYAASLAPYYNRQAISFAFQHPGAEFELVLAKLFTLFRPDTKVHSLRSPSGIAKAVLALPVVFFLLALLLPGRPSFSFDDKLLVAVEVLYVLPFLITNSDPRFRIPLDAVLLLHAVSLVYRRHFRSLSSSNA